MFGSSSLQTPKSGRSRFSKALPAPPSFPSEEDGPTLTAPSNPPPYQNYQHTRTPVRQSPASPTGGLPFLKELPPIDLGPPLPPPKAFEEGIFGKEAGVTNLVKPLNSPLPQLPLKPGPPPPMSIPRRPSPVTLPAPSPVPVSTAAPSLAPSAAPDIAPTVISPNPLPSPVTSLSSLLSAYTDHTSESTPRTSTNSTKDSPGTKDPYPPASPNPGASRGTDSPTLPAGPQTQSGVRDDQPLPPPLPEKDYQPQPQSRVGTQDVSPTVNTSPTEQLWRRRSVKSDKNIAVPELKLTSSNGSTVASGNITNSSQGAPSGVGSTNSVPLSSHVQEQTEFSNPTKITTPLPRSTNAGLPGKNIRPVPSRQQIKEDGSAMGQLVSKSNSKGQRAWSRERDNKGDGKTGVGSMNQHTPTTSAPGKSLPNTKAPQIIARLPTPDYENHEPRGPYSATVISPVSPASSPELPIDGSSAVSPTSPRGAAENTYQALEPNQGFSNLDVRRPLVGLPSSPAASRIQNRPVNQGFPARTSSKAKAPSDDVGTYKQAAEIPESLQVGNQRQLPTPAFNTPDISPVSRTGSAELEKTSTPSKESPQLGVNNDTSFPGPKTANEELEDNMTDNPGAMLFPRDWFSPLPADGVMDALPLTDRHFRCITNHRYMTANRQRYNPIACATCGQRDRISDAYICSACSLNVCPTCSGNLRRCRGDLRQLLQQIKDMGTTTDEDDRTVTITQMNGNGGGDQIVA
ncbi:hypothetical protein V8F33_005461 [Rhypophila sp. PSN 637]